MARLTNYDIYKTYKHGESLSALKISIDRIYRALKDNYLEVYKVKDMDDEFHLFVYVPEINKFQEIEIW